MKNIRPLPELDPGKLLMLKDIYDRCDRYDIYEDVRYARNRNVFIDDQTDFDWILKNVLYGFSIDATDLENMYSAQRCRGINFNVITAHDYVHAHADYNPTKLNILITEEKCSEILFVDSGESWDYRSPALLDVSKRHLVTNIQSLTEPRIMLQVFLRHEFANYVARLA